MRTKVLRVAIVLEFLIVNGNAEHATFLRQQMYLDVDNIAGSQISSHVNSIKHYAKGVAMLDDSSR